MELSLEQIAVKLSKAETAFLEKSTCRRRVSASSVITAEACMPKEVLPNAEFKFMRDGEFSFLVGLNGSCNGIQFCMGENSYKFVGSRDNILGQKKVFLDLGFQHVPPFELRGRKKEADRKKPLGLEGFLPFSPQETTQKLSAYTYSRVSTKAGNIAGLVVCDGGGCHYFKPGSQAVVDASIRELISDYGYDPFEEKK